MRGRAGSRSTCPRILACAVVVAAVAGALAGAAHADRYEASVHAQPVGGVAFVGDPASGETATSPIVGLGVRVSYARSNLYQYDAQLTAATTGAAAFDQGAFTIGGDAVPSAPFTVTTRILRFDAGITLRFGLRLVPTLRLAVGVQERFRGTPVIRLADGDHEGADGRDGDNATDVYGFAAAGLDYRVNRRLTIGASVGAAYAVPLNGPSWRTLEGSAHVAWYWYPLWFE